MGHQIKKWIVANSLRERKQPIAFNCVAGLSKKNLIGYDEGMMSGVNNAKNYIELMRFGHAEAIDGSVNAPAVANSLL